MSGTVLHRRGQAGPVSLVLVYIILVLVLLISVAIAVYIHNTFKDPEAEAQCASQIRVHSAIVNFTGGKAQPVITCPSKLVTVKAKNEEAAKRELAEQMRRCWGMWGEGQLQLFGKEQGVYCHVCSVVTIKGVDRLNDFPQYLDETTMKNGQTYSQYLSGSKSGIFTDRQFIEQARAKPIATDTPVGVIFYHTKGLDGYTRFKNMVLRDTTTSTAAGAVTGVVIGLGIAKVGAVMTGTGVLSIPGAITIGVGLVVGAASGLVASTYGTSYPDTMSIVVVRPVTEEGIKGLGCQYAPVSN